MFYTMVNVYLPSISDAMFALVSYACTLYTHVEAYSPSPSTSASPSHKYMNTNTHIHAQAPVVVGVFSNGGGLARTLQSHSAVCVRVCVCVSVLCCCQPGSLACWAARVRSATNGARCSARCANAPTRRPWFERRAAHDAVAVARVPGAMWRRRSGRRLRSLRGRVGS